MKKLNLFVAVLVFAVNMFAADPLTERLQRGLFEEEANRNLDAAIKEYQSVVTQADEQRKVIATALFRLGECYRKLGRTNDANAFYQRIVRDFSEQEQLAKLAADFLKPAITAAPAGNPSDLVRELQRRAAVLKVESMTALMEYERLTTLTTEQLARSSAATNSPALAQLEPQLLVTEQKLVLLKQQQQLGDGHPEVKAITALQKTIRQQYDDALIGIVSAAQQRADSLAAQLRVVDAELKKAGAATTESPRAATETTSLTQAEAEDLARVKTLARNSPDLLRAPSAGFTELQRAARSGHYSVVEFLLSQDVKPDDVVPGYSPLDEAAQRGHLRIVQLLLDRGATKDDASKALMSACESGFKSVAELLIARGADVNGRTDRNVTPLHFAARRGQTAIVDMLLKRGAQPDVLSADQNQRLGFSGFSIRGATPLHFAVDQPNASMAAQLINAGANVNATNFEGRTPLHLAAAKGDTNLGALLLAHGADPNATVTSGETVLGVAIGSKRADFVTQLLRGGADVNLAGLYYRDSGTESPLILAARSGSHEVMTVLLATKPNLEATNQNGNTALGTAVRNRLDDYAEKLLEAGANPNVTDSSGYPLIRLALDVRARMVDALLRHGANPNVMNNGETPLSVVLRLLNGPQPGSPGMMPTAGQKPPDRKAELEQMAASLRQHGADEFLQRRGFISAVRGSEQRVTIFSKGTNDVNRYTLMEFLAAVYENGGFDFPFPDFASITIHRLDGKSEKPIRVNVLALMLTTNCLGDQPLEWGDNVEIPMADHQMGIRWAGFAGPERITLQNCVQRTVRFRAGGTDGTFILSPKVGDGANGFVTRSPFFLLSSTVLRNARFSSLLRTSSDLSRVTVMRLDPQTKETRKMTFDLNAVALPDMSYSSGNQPPIPWAHDLWLRDGDVIEVPEKP